MHLFFSLLIISLLTIGKAHKLSNILSLSNIFFGNPDDSCDIKYYRN